ncbi:MAG: uracil-DNA glycosylase [Acholeplasmatales bacterium]|nr:uracil-DNA glycosylase [Acholeplasmatales bacterium]
MEWLDFIEEEKEKDYYEKLMNIIVDEYANNLCHPRYDQIYNAFFQTKLNDVKVVILGQDPYHEIGQAHGLAFSVLCKKLPPSLVNIYKEMSSDLGQEVNQNGDLTYLAKQGVLLLNTVLSVRNGDANSHKKLGWEIFTDNAIKLLNSLDQPIVYILWGAPAQSKIKYLNNPKHLIITSAHPSPLSSYRGFFGSKPFSKTNEFLRNNGVEEIKWIKA